MRREVQLSAGWLSMAEIVDMLNAGELARGGVASWNRWNAHVLCVRAGVRFFQRAPRCKRYTSAAELQEAIREAIRRDPRDLDDG